MTAQFFAFKVHASAFSMNNDIRGAFRVRQIMQLPLSLKISVSAIPLSSQEAFARIALASQSW